MLLRGDNFMHDCALPIMQAAGIRGGLPRWTRALNTTQGLDQGVPNGWSGAIPDLLGDAAARAASNLRAAAFPPSGAPPPTGSGEQCR